MIKLLDILREVFDKSIGDIVIHHVDDEGKGSYRTVGELISKQYWDGIEIEKKKGMSGKEADETVRTNLWNDMYYYKK